MVAGRESRQVLGGIGRVGLLHRGDDHVGRVVGEGRVKDGVGVELGLVGVEELLAGGLHRNPGLRTHQTFGGGARQLGHLVGTGAVAEGEYRRHLQLARLLQERAASGIHAAVEHGVGLLALDLGQHGLPVDGLVGALFARQDLDAGGLEGLLDLVGEAFAIGGGIVDDGDGLWLAVGGQVVGNGRTLLIVAADDAEYALEALLGQRRVGCGAGDHRDVGAVVDRRGGDRGAGVEVADNAGDLGINKFLRHGVADLRIGLVIFRHDFELDLLAADGDSGRVGFVNGEADAILVVLAQVRDAAGERRDAADLDHHWRGRGRCLDRGRRRRCFLAATHHGDGGKHGKRNEFHGYMHVNSPFGSGKDWMIRQLMSLSAGFLPCVAGLSMPFESRVWR